MPRSEEKKRPRASNGRFVKRTRAAKDSAGSSGPGPTRGDASSEKSDVVPHGPSSRREERVRLALLTLAILFAALGFALSLFWVVALVLMGVLWGAMLVERPQRQGTVSGLVAEVVTAVVDEARDVRDAASGSDRDAVTEPSPVGEARTTED
jgi:hypothetical protein